VKQNNQVRRETKQSTARAQQRNFPHAAQTKMRKPNRKPRKRNSDTVIVQVQRETKKINRTSPKKQSPVTSTALTKNCGSPTGNLENPNPKKS
jgi:hypothetical protein